MVLSPVAIDCIRARDRCAIDGYEGRREKQRLRLPNKAHICLHPRTHWDRGDIVDRQADGGPVRTGILDTNPQRCYLQVRKRRQRAAVTGVYRIAMGRQNPKTEPLLRAVLIYCAEGAAKASAEIKPLEP